MAFSVKSHRLRSWLQHKSLRSRFLAIFMLFILICLHWSLFSTKSTPVIHTPSSAYTDTLHKLSAGSAAQDGHQTDNIQVDYHKMDDTFIESVPKKDYLKKEPIVEGPKVDEQDFLGDDNPLPIASGNEKEPKLEYIQPYLLINRHFGVQNDIQYLADQLGFTFDHISKDEMFGEGVNKVLIRDNDFLFEDEMEKPIVKQYVDKFCSKYEVIIVADTNGDGRMLLERLDRRPQDCPRLKKLIFLTTNRFDFHNGWTYRDPDVEKYYQLIKRIMAKKDLQVDIRWISNNPYEIKYGEIRLNSPIQNYELIRSFGYSPVKPIDISVEERKKVAMSNTGWQACFFDQLSTRHGIPNLTPLVHDYGGPETLAKYRAYVEIPYQVSTMKLYENLAQGVVVMVPSYEFYNRLMDGEGPSCALYWGFQVVGFNLRAHIPDWRLLSDYYHPDFSDLIYYFDSFEQLKDMLSRDVLDTKNVKERGPERFKKLREQSRDKWLHVLVSKRP